MDELQQELDTCDRNIHNERCWLETDKANADRLNHEAKNAPTSPMVNYTLIRLRELKRRRASVLREFQAPK